MVGYCFTVREPSHYFPIRGSHRSLATRFYIGLVWILAQLITFPSVCVVFLFNLLFFSVTHPTEIRFDTAQAQKMLASSCWESRRNEVKVHENVGFPNNYQMNTQLAVTKR